MIRKLLYITLLIILHFSAFAQVNEDNNQVESFLNDQLKSLNSYYPANKFTSNNVFIKNKWDLSYETVSHYINNYNKDILIHDSHKLLNALEIYLNKYPGKTSYLLESFKKLKKESGKVFSDYNIPEKYLLLPSALSAFNPDYSLTANSSGIWQMRLTPSMHYGIEINKYIDQRKDNKKSTEAVAKMLNDFYKRYENYELSVFVLISGPVAVNKAISKSGSENPRDVYRFLPHYAKNVYTAFLALQQIVVDKEKFYDKNIAFKTIRTDTLTVDKKLHFEQITEFLDISNDLVKTLNPVFTGSIIPASENHKVKFILPAEITSGFNSNIDSIANINYAQYFGNNDQQNKDKPAPAPDIPAGDYVPVNYTVKRGDNIGYISEWFDVAASELRLWNGLRGNFIKAGQVLVVYVHKSKKDQYQKIDKLGFREKQLKEGNIFSEKVNNQDSRKRLKKGEYTLYTVKSGDSPWKIAKQFPGVTDGDILKWNAINPQELKPGQKLKIKKNKDI